MEYKFVSEIAEKRNVSKRTVRNYANNNRITGAKLEGRSWRIPNDADKPDRLNKKLKKQIILLDILKEEKKVVEKVVFIIKFKLI